MHVFIAPNDTLLDSWRQAFPAAVLHDPANGDRPPPSVRCIWLRLRPGVPVAAQITQVRHALTPAPMVVMADCPSDEEALEAFDAGVSGYVNSHAAPCVLESVAETVAQQGLWVGPSLMRRLLTAVASAPPRATSPRNDWQQPLTPREIEVAHAVAAGAVNKEIARQCDITERTVKAHVSSVLEKLHLRDRLHLALVVNGHSQN